MTHVSSDSDEVFWGSNEQVQSLNLTDPPVIYQPDLQGREDAAP